MSDKPLLERLRVKGARTFAVANLDPKLEAGFDLPCPRVAVEAADVVLAFAANRTDLDAMLPGVLKALKPGAILWVAYPKLTSKLAGDLNRDIIHNLVPAYGLDTVSQIAVDADWSALRFKRVAAP
jgi:hypothetical protein